MKEVVKAAGKEELYKNEIRAHRAALRMVSSLFDISIGNNTHPLFLIDYQKKVERELILVCNDVLETLDTHLIPSAAAHQSKVFYWKMKGDCYRYIAELKTGAERSDAAAMTFCAYKHASDIVVKEISAAHPTRLELAVDFAVFCGEILGLPKKARIFSQNVLNAANGDLLTLKEEPYKESMRLLQLPYDMEVKSARSWMQKVMTKKSVTVSYS
ncbi:hypothetical protein R1flu_001828 [Riccia fluitans]|uniref:14-3-3 domain-containing protein n=1 Tax=Riccia fluitans TaxID=41844 RepID=A0ABD1Y4D8_9MARC